MSQRTEAPVIVAPPATKTDLTATIPPSGRTTATGKARGFAGLPQTTGDEIERLSNTVPTDYDSAETVKAADASGALLKVYLFDPSKEEFGGDDGPRTISVFSESGADADLDLDGAIDFRDQVAALLPKLDAMISSLAADVRTEPPKTPEAQPSALAAVCEALTNAAISELCASTGLAWLGEDGPVFFVGQFRVRALFRGADGRFWGDAALAAESVTAGREITKAVRDAWMDAAGGGVEQYDLMVCTPQRGEWNALITPMDRIAAQLHLPAPLPAPDGWARYWSSFPDMSEEQHLVAVEAGVWGQR